MSTTTKVRKFFRLTKNARYGIFVFVITLFAFVAFEPLFDQLGQSPGQEFASAIFGTIFAAVITMVLLNKQTENQEGQDKNNKVFEQKLTLYNETLDKLQNIFDITSEGEVKLDPRKVIQIEFMLAKIIMIGDEKTIREFKSFYQTVTNKYSSETGIVTLNAYDKQVIFRFADYCREELGLTDKNLEKHVLEDIVVQSELFYRIGNLTLLDPNTIETVREIYSFLLFNLNMDSRNIDFSPNGFEVYCCEKHNDSTRFLICEMDNQNVYLTLPHDNRLKSFDAVDLRGQHTIVLRSDAREQIKLRSDTLEKLIRENYNKTLD